MRSLFVAVLLLVNIFSNAFESDAGIKGFQGESGQKIYTLESKDSKELLIYTVGIGGELEGKTSLYSLDVSSSTQSEAYFMKKSGSKKNRWVVFSQRGKSWMYSDPTRPNFQFSLTYSPELSNGISAEKMKQQFSENKKEGDKK